MKRQPDYFDPPLKRQPHAIEGLSFLLGGIGLALIVSALFLERDREPQQIRMTGRLVLEGEPLAEATVWVAGQEARAFSDAIGEFTLDPVKTGNATLMVRRGPLKVGLPIKIPANQEWNAGSLPCFLWRPNSGKLGDMPKRTGKITVAQ